MIHKHRPERLLWAAIVAVFAMLVVGQIGLRLIPDTTTQYQNNGGYPIETDEQRHMRIQEIERQLKELERERKRIEFERQLDKPRRPDMRR